jgi:hypothetical protein
MPQRFARMRPPKGLRAFWDGVVSDDRRLIPRDCLHRAAGCRTTAALEPFADIL